MKKFIFTIWSLIILAIIEAIVFGLWWNTRNNILMLIGVVIGAIITIAAIFIFELMKKDF